MEVGYRLFEGTKDFKKIELEMAIFCDQNGYCLEDGYEDGVRYLIINPPYVPPLDEWKAKKIAELKSIRDALEVKPIEWNGALYDYDDKARDRLGIARRAIEDGIVDTIDWTTAGNTRVTIGLTDFIGINAAAAARSNMLHVKYNELKVQVHAAETAEDVAAVVW